MDKQFYRSLLPLVNDPDHYALMQEYASARIASFLKQLETAKDIERIREIQGAIAELRRFKTLQDEVRKGAE